jgi:hypothetical protein
MRLPPGDLCPEVGGRGRDPLSAQLLVCAWLLSAPPRWAGSGLPLGLPGAYGPRSTLWRLRLRSEGGINRALYPAQRCVSRPDEIPCPLNTLVCARLLSAPPRWAASRGSVPRGRGSGLPLGLPGAYGPRSTLWRLSRRSEGRINRVLDAAPRTRLPPADPCAEVGGHMRGGGRKGTRSPVVLLTPHLLPAALSALPVAIPRGSVPRGRGSGPRPREGVVCGLQATPREGVVCSLLATPSARCQGGLAAAWPPPAARCQGGLVVAHGRRL